MDARQFDAITRTLSAGTERRRVLGVLAGGLAAVLAGQRAAVAHHKADHCANEGQKVTPGKPTCCSGRDPVDGRCPADLVPLEGMCTSAPDGACECRDAQGPCASTALCSISKFGGCGAPGTPCTCVR
jgi:hypothetical protein